jgi:hypothetical protein
MSLELSLELGWIITDRPETLHLDSKWFFEGFTPGEDGIYRIPVEEVKAKRELRDFSDLTIETHPTDTSRVFISLRVIGHGDTELSEPEELGRIVREYVKHHVGTRGYSLRWAIIETVR